MRLAAKLNVALSLYYVSIIPDRYDSVSMFISDRPSVSIETNFFRHDFRNGGRLERSDSESDTRRIGYLSIRSEKLMETHLER